MPDFNEIDAFEPEFAPDQYSREALDALIAEVWTPRVFPDHLRAARRTTH